MHAVAQATADRTAHGDHRTTIHPATPRPAFLSDSYSSRVSSNDARATSAAAATGNLNRLAKLPLRVKKNVHRLPRAPLIAECCTMHSCNLWTERRARWTSRIWIDWSKSSWRISCSVRRRPFQIGFQRSVLAVLSQSTDLCPSATHSPQIMPLGHSRSTDQQLCFW